MTKIDRLLQSTSAGQLAQQLDAADGKKDGKISASVWNSFVDGKGGKDIKNYINVENAMNSITSYAVKNSQSSGTKIDDLMNKWINNSPALDPNPPKADANPPKADPNPPASEAGSKKLKAIEAKYPNNAGRTIKIGDFTYEHDEKGYLTSIENSSGKETLHVWRNDDGSVDLYERYEYNGKDGNEPDFTAYNPDGSVKSYTRSDYDANGNMTKRTWYDSDGSVKDYYRYEYDDKGNETKCTRYNPDGSVKEYNRFEYDDNGNNTKETWYNPDGSVKEYCRSEYDDKGNNTKYTKCTFYNPDGSIQD